MKLIKKRQVRNKYIYVAFASLVLMCLSYYGYHRFKIGYGIAIESRHYFKKAKAFFFNYEFFGNVVDRKYIEGDATAYFIVVRLDSDIIIPEWGRTFYYNYYVFDLDNNTMQFLVSKQIYNNVSQGDCILKRKNSDSIYINNKSYLLFSKEDLKWIPRLKCNLLNATFVQVEEMVSVNSFLSKNRTVKRLGQ